MLKTMRSNIKSLSWVLWLVILTFVGFIFVQWGAGRLESGGDKTDVAWVGRTPISGSDFQRVLAKTVDNYRNQMKSNFNRTMLLQLGIAEQVIQNLVNAIVIQKEAERFHLEVSDDELKRAIRAYPAFQRDGRFIGAEEYERMLAYSQIQVMEFEANMRNELLADKLKELVACALPLDPRDLKEEYIRENDKADIEFIAFKPEEVKEEIQLSDNELRAYYDAHLQQFQTPEKRSAALIFFRFDDFKKSVAVTDKDLYDYYKANKNTFRVPGKTQVARIYLKYDDQTREATLKKAEELRTTLTKENFAAKAQEISQDEKAKEGGDWGYWGWQAFTSQEQSLIEKLEAGGISTPVDVVGAFAILYVPERVLEKQESYEEVRTRIRSMLERERLRQLALEKVDQVYEKVKGEKNLMAVSGQKGILVSRTPLLSMGQALANVDGSGYISQKLFSLHNDEIAPPLELPEGMAIVQLQQTVKPEQEKFDSAKENVRKELLNIRKVDRLMARAQQLAPRLAKISDPQKVAELLQKENLKAETSEYRRGDRLGEQPRLKGLDAIIFSLGEGSYSPPLRLGNQVIIVKLKNKKTVSDQDFQKEREAFVQKKAETLKNGLFATYILNKRNEYRIRLNSALYQKIKDYVLAR